ncbi:MAG: prepilin peptidase [Candidatus Staskawiczbacteria bacterium]|jgi:prepilin signal peptidase PulO-like enzyme (type II secretory pathway)
MIFLSIIYIFVFLFGLVIGSFLNCVIYRLEQKKSLNGRSFCPDCRHKLSWQDLFPVFSFLFLKGKCRYCHKKISIQYPLVETAAAILFLIIFITFPQHTIYNILNTIFLFYIASSLIIIFVYDLKNYIIPDKILFPAIIITFVYNFFPTYNIQHTIYNIIAAISASAFFLIIFLASKGKWMGLGDVKLAFLMGLLLGMPNIFVALFLAFFFGAIIGVILMVLEKKSLKSEIPFGPFLVIGTLVAVICGNQIIQWYLHLLLI